MDFIIKLEQSLFKTQNEDESFEQLLFNLERQNQINYYDFVFKNAEENEKENIYKGLSRVLKILVISIARVNKLYPKRKINYIDHLNDIIEILQNENIVEDSLTFPDFYDYLYSIIEIIDPNHTSDLNYTKNTVIYEPNYGIYPYFIIGNKASSFSIDSIVDGYFNDENIVRIFSSVNLVPLKTGPHYNSYNSVYDFFIHDVLHTWDVIQAIVNMYDSSIFDIHKQFYLKCKKKGTLSFVHRFASFVYFSSIHEYWYFTFFEEGYDNSISDFLIEMGENFNFENDIDDIKLCLKWVEKSYDLEGEFDSEDSLEILNSLLEIFKERMNIE